MKTRFREKKKPLFGSHYITFPGVDFIKLGVGRRGHPNLGNNAIRKLRPWRKYMMPYWRNLCKKDGCRAQILSVGHKLLYEITPGPIGTTGPGG